MTVVVDQPEIPETMDFENDYDFGPSPALDALTKDVENIGATGSSGGSHGSGVLKPLAPLSMSSGNKAPLPKLGKLPPPTLISIAEEPVVPVAKKNNESEAEKAARRAARKKEKALRNSKDGKSSRKSRDKSLRHSRESADETSACAPNAADVSIDSAASVDVPRAMSDAPMPASAALAASSCDSSAPLVVGTVVEARFGGKGTWFKGAITAVHETHHTNGSMSQKFDIAYDDGGEEFGVARLRVRRCGEEQPCGPLAPGTPCEARLGTKCYPATVTAAHIASGDDSETTYSVQYADGDFEKHVARNLIFVQCEYPPSCTDNATTESAVPKLQVPALSGNTVAPELTTSKPLPSEPEADLPSAEEQVVEEEVEAPPVDVSLANVTVPVPESTNASAEESSASETVGSAPSAAVTSAAIAEPSVAEPSTVVAADSDAGLSSIGGSTKELVDSDPELVSKEAASVAATNNTNNEVSQVNKKLSLTPTEEAVPTHPSNETVTEKDVATAKKLFAEPTGGLQEESSVASANATSAEVGNSSVIDKAPPVVSADATRKEVTALELAPFVVGERVEGRYGGGEEWCLGHITAVHRGVPSSSTITDVGGGRAALVVPALDGSTFDVAYDDGDVESGVVALRLRRQGDEALEVLSRGTRCEARYGGGLKCYPGTITAVFSPSSLSSPSSTTAGKSYTIAYDDGDEEVEVARELIFVQCWPLEWRKQQMLANAKLLLNERNAQSQEPNQPPHSVAEVEESKELAPVAATEADEVTSVPKEEAQEEGGSSLVEPTEDPKSANTDVATADDGPNPEKPEPQPEHLLTNSEEPLKPLRTTEVEPTAATVANAATTATTTGEFMGMLGSPPPLKVLLAHAKKLGVKKSQCSGSLAAQWAQVPKAVQQLVAASLQAPLPTGWVLQPDEPATRYLNQWTNQGQPQHPLDDYYREKIQEFVRDHEETTGSNLLEQPPPEETIKPCQAAQQEIEFTGGIIKNGASVGPVAGVASAMATAEAAAAAAVSAAASMAKELAVSQAQVASLSAELKVAHQTIQDLQQQQQQHQQQHKEETESEVQESKDSVQRLQDSTTQNRKSSRQSSFGKFFSALLGRRNEKIVP